MTPAESRIQAEREDEQLRREFFERMGLPPDFDAELAILRGEAPTLAAMAPAPDTLQ